MATKKKVEEVTTAEETTVEEVTNGETEGKETQVEDVAIKTAKQEQEKIVRFKLFKDGDKYRGNKFVGVNGKGYLIKRGEWVDLPESVYNVLALSEEQIQVAERVMEESRMVEYK